MDHRTVREVELCVDVATATVSEAEARPSSSRLLLATTTLQIAATFVQRRALPGDSWTRAALSSLDALRDRAAALEQRTRSAEEVGAAAATLTNLGRHRPAPVVVTFSFGKLKLKRKRKRDDSTAEERKQRPRQARG